MTSSLDEIKTAYEGGATRSQSTQRFDLVPPIAEQKLAERFGLGAIKHGDTNWKGGGKDFIKATISHLQAHVTKLKHDGQALDDNIGAILWAGAALAWFEENKPEEFKTALNEMR